MSIYADKGLGLDVENGSFETFALLGSRWSICCGDGAAGGEDGNDEMDDEEFAIDGRSGEDEGRRADC